MTTRRLPHNRPTVALTAGDDQPEPACSGNSWPYDMLVDHGISRSTRLALRVARETCGGCPIRDACLEANREERWAQAVTDTPFVRTLPPGSRTGAALARYNQARALAVREQRLPALRRLLAAGSTIEDACDLLSVERETLRIWCKRNGHLDLYRELSGRKGWAA